MTPEKYGRAGELFDKLAGLPPERQEDYLDAACGSDTDLRDYIAELLRAEREAPESFLAQPAIQEAVNLIAESTASNPPVTGTQLGAYVIGKQIGAGGMGTVYEAQDVRLNRKVAIKILPPPFLGDPDRIQRFRQEARAASLLNHPNIVSIYDAELAQGRCYIATEFVEGTTLRQLAAEGPMDLTALIEIAIQICSALGAAHQAGIVHRDIKPENVMLRPDGIIKVLDFGLAKLLDPLSGETGHPVDISHATKTMQTRPGSIAGTLQYLSPEQIMGKLATPRSDIFSLGVMLYELAAGVRPFAGPTEGVVFSNILNQTPDRPSTLRPSIPRELDELIMRALEKDPELRFQTASDLRSALKLLLRGSHSGTNSAPSVAARAPTRRYGAGILAIAAAASIVLGALLWRATRAVVQPLKPLVRLSVDLGPEVSLGTQTGAAVIISPDGTRLVYVSERRLYARELDQPNAIELAGTEGAEAPFFSPDGKWVAFFAQGKLKKTLVSGGPPITLCDAATSRGGSWGEDGNIIAALNSTTGLSRIPSAGGAPTPVTELANGEVTHRWPQILPGGKALLFAAHNSVAGWDGANIEVMSLVDRSRRTLQRGGTYGRYVPSGHLIYVNRGTLFAVPFDLHTLAARGTPVQVLEQIAYSTYGAAQIDFSGNGTLVYQSRVAGATGHFIVQWLDGTNKTRPLLMKPGDYFYPKLSPDGQRLAMAVGAESGGQDIWIYELQGERMTRLTFSVGANIYPLWSADGRYILSGGDRILWTRANGAGKPEPLTQSHGGRQYPLSFTPDGKLLAFSEVNPGTGYDLFTVPVEDDGSRLRAGKPEVFLQTPFNEIDASFSPDGRWMAYSSDDSGSYQVYVRAFPDRGGKTQISNAGGLRPVWSRTARELFFENLDNQIMMAAYAVRGDSFVAEKPRLWSEQKLMSIVFDNYDVAPDGKRIAAIVPTDAPDVQAQSHVIFLENFFDELRRRVPVGSK